MFLQYLPVRVSALCMILLLLAGCSPFIQPARVASVTPTYRDLIALPAPKGKIKVAVYNFRDQTWQYKPLPNVSSFSTAVTQGSTAVLNQTLKDSGWFIPVEREGLQNLLTERKIIRAALEKQGQDLAQTLPPLDMANVIIEGGVIGYDTNIVTGGLGGKYFGVGGATECRKDRITVCLRAVDVRSGRILKSVTTTKTVLSREVSAGVFRFISYKRLLEAETGLTTNEPVHLAVTGAIEKAVVGLVVEGILDGIWALEDPGEMQTPVIQDYLAEAEDANRFLTAREDPLGDEG
ncbi:CsgG/HfaB family protein [Desulfuromonas sp.]|uniref:CsgG/HfaB family protein n=1 Tax=Desulfuromonas sp. TaxID=892 RepID=UPI0025C36680|nr:CsgG/HfaB family protein [Desulfuromonas sp.]